MSVINEKRVKYKAEMRKITRKELNKFLELAGTKQKYLLESPMALDLGLTKYKLYKYGTQLRGDGYVMQEIVNVLIDYYGESEFYEILTIAKEQLKNDK